MKIKTKINLLSKVQPACEDLGFIVGAILGSCDLEGGVQGINSVKKRFNNYYKKVGYVSFVTSYY